MSDSQHSGHSAEYDEIAANIEIPLTYGGEARQMTATLENTGNTAPSSEVAQDLNSEVEVPDVSIQEDDIPAVDAEASRIDELSSEMNARKLDRSIFACLPLTTLCILATLAAEQMDTIMRSAVPRMNKEAKEVMGNLSHNQVIISKLIQECVVQLLDSSTTLDRQRTEIVPVPNINPTPDSLPKEVMVPLEVIAKENIMLRQEVSKLEAQIPFNPAKRDMKNECGLRGRSYNFHSAINCCSGSAFIKNMDDGTRKKVMELAHTFPLIYPPWKRSLIVLDSVCTCKGISDACPIRKAILKINDRFPEAKARFTERFLPRIMVKTSELFDDPDKAWGYVKEAFPSNADFLGSTPRVITRWKNIRENASCFIFEVTPEVRHLIAGKFLRNSSSSISITDSVYVPFCKKCKKLGHNQSVCTESPNPRSESCSSCSAGDHHPFSLNCATRDRIIRSKLSRIDYGASFRNSIVLYQ